MNQRKRRYESGPCPCSNCRERKILLTDTRQRHIKRFGLYRSEFDDSASCPFAEPLEWDINETELENENDLIVRAAQHSVGEPDALAKILMTFLDKHGTAALFDNVLAVLFLLMLSLHLIGSRFWLKLA